MKKSILMMILLVNIFGCLQSMMAMQAKMIVRNKIQKMFQDIEIQKEKGNDTALYQLFENVLLLFDKDYDARYYIDSIGVAQEALDFARHTNNQNKDKWIAHFEKLLEKYVDWQQEAVMQGKAIEEESLAREYEIKGEIKTAQNMYLSAVTTLEQLLAFYQNKQEIAKALDVNVKMQQLYQKMLNLSPLLAQQQKKFERSGQRKLDKDVQLKIDTYLYDINIYEKKPNPEDLQAKYQIYVRLFEFLDSNDEARSYIKAVNVVSKALKDAEKNNNKPWIKYFKESLEKYINLEYEDALLANVREEESLAREYEIKGEINKAQNMYLSAVKTLEQLLVFYQQAKAHFNVLTKTPMVDSKIQEIDSKISKVDSKIQEIDSKKLGLSLLFEQQQQKFNTKLQKEIQKEREKFDQAIEFANKLKL